MGSKSFPSSLRGGVILVFLGGSVKLKLRGLRDFLHGGFGGGNAESRIFCGILWYCLLPEAERE